jgi:hypothetical protein
MNETLEEEKNFKDCIPTEVNTPLFTKDDELKRLIAAEETNTKQFVRKFTKDDELERLIAEEEKNKTKQFVRKYATTLQKNLDHSNVKMMKLDTYEADVLIEKDFLNKPD